MAEAKAVYQPAKVTGVVVEMTREEALAIWHLTRRVSESPNKEPGAQTVKAVTNRVRDAIEMAFEGDVHYTDLASTSVFGGRVAARTGSLYALDPRSWPLVVAPTFAVDGECNGAKF
jgi:hypothetical protein